MNHFPPLCAWLLCWVSLIGNTFSQPTPSGLELHPLPSRSSSPSGAATLFEELSASQTGVDFQLRLPDAEKFIQEIIHLSVYGGLCTGDYDGDELPDLYVTSPLGGNKLYRNRGGFRFEDVTQSAGVADTNFWGTGATFVDIDNDGDLDLYACGYRKPNRLYINQGHRADGQTRFIEQAAPFGLAHDGASMMMAFADIDNDGDLDGYLATTALPPPPGVKFRVTYQNEKPVIAPELQEYWAMIYLPDGKVHPTEAGQFDKLFRNDGGRFTDITRAAGITGAYFTLGAIWWDYNADGRPDLYVANDYLGPDQLYRNNGDGTFTDVIRDVIPHTPWSSMGMDLADLNNDGRIDLMTTDMRATTHYRRQVMRGETTKTGWFLEFAEPRQYARNSVYLSTGNGRVFETAYQMNLAATDWTWGPRLEDFDNDGRVDAFIANGMLRDVQNADLGGYADRVLGGGSARWAKFWSEQPMQKEQNLAFRNLGDLRFERVETAWGLGRLGVSLGSATADFDGDGDLDLVVSNADAPLSLYRNNSVSGNFLRVRLKGTTSNRSGIGATVRLRTEGAEQVRCVTLARGWLSASEPVVHFGLGGATNIEQLSVDWPGGQRQSFTNLAVNQLCSVTEPTERRALLGRAAPITDLPSNARRSLFAESTLLRDIPVSSTPFDDFAREPLLPRKLSERVFCMVWGDVNGDGRADLFLGGPAGVAGRVFLQGAAGRFSSTEQPALAQDKDFEDADAVFFDFDKDGDQDLFVASGSVRNAPGSALYHSRLYLNEGRGQFKKAPARTVPEFPDSAGAVAAADFDRDGDVDVFVGGYSVPGQFPTAAASHLFVNQNGSLSDQVSEALRRVGLVTDAIWTDVNGDNWPDLLVATDWGFAQLFKNEQGRLVPVTKEAGLAVHRGQWNALAAGDVDGDGDVDFVAGNLGLNTPYAATLEKPQLLFRQDWDGSGKPQLLEAYFEGELGYPQRGLDALATVMPSLRGKFPSFDAFARAPIENVFSMNALGQAARIEANTLESGVFLNDGQGRFAFAPLPALAQVAPARDLALLDLNADGRLDLVIAQNDFSPHRDTGRMDGGVSLVLLGNGRGGFDPLWPAQSGLNVSGEALRVATPDLNGDGRTDVVFGVSGQGLRAFLNQGNQQP